MLCFMRSLEVHIVETASDVDLAIKAGLLEPQHLDYSTCSECDDAIGHVIDDGSFEPFAVVIDVDDADWVVCTDCASPVTDGDLRRQMTPDSYEHLMSLKKSDSLLDEDDFDLDEF